MSSSRGTPVTLILASLTSVISPSGLIVTNGSTAASIRLRAYRTACLSSVMLRLIIDVPTIAPSASRIGETVSETRNTDPSFRTRMVSRWSMCWPALTLARTSFISSGRSLGVTVSAGLPTISSDEYPYSLSAAGFQLVTMPPRVLPMMASSENSTTAAISWASSTACFSLPMSGTAVTQHGIAGVDPGRADTDIVRAVAEQPSRVAIYQRDRSPLLVHPHEGIRNRLHQNLGLRRRREHLTPS